MALPNRVPVEVLQSNFRQLTELLDIGALQSHLQGHSLLKPSESGIEEFLDSPDSNVPSPLNQEEWMHSSQYWKMKRHERLARCLDEMKNDLPAVRKGTPDPL